MPRTDAILDDPRLAPAIDRLGRQMVKAAVATVQQGIRRGELDPHDAVAATVELLPVVATTQRPVLNATGVLLHTNLGRAPLSAAARDALLQASGTTDVELDLATGGRGRRGQVVVDALVAAVPAAQGAHVVNNGAAALILAATAFAHRREIVIARGEMVAIGDGFRIPDLLVSTGARLREVGTTNRVTLADYTDAMGPRTGFVLKVHPSNFVVSGFTQSVGVADLAGLPVPVIADIGSGLLRPHPRLPDEPDAQSMLAAGAALVTASGDKLLGGPQAGLILGCRDLVDLLRRHPLARALRVDKLTLAALEATLRGPAPPTELALAVSSDQLLNRARAVAGCLAGRGVDVEVVPSEGSVGGGGAPGVVLPSAALRLPEDFCRLLRQGEPAVLGRVSDGRCLLDLLALAPDQDPVLCEAVLAAAKDR